MTSSIGPIVPLSIASGLVLGLALDFVVFAGGTEAQMTGGALVALGTGFALLAVASASRTNQPQLWALLPAAVASFGGLLLLALEPGDTTLGRLGWIWPVAVAALVAWSVRGARRSLRSKTRRAVLYPALFVLLLVAAGGAFETIAQATSSNRMPAGRTYLVNGHRLYLSCAGAGTPTVVLFNGLGERTPSWAWIERDVARMTRVCVFDRAGQGWSGSFHGRQDGAQLASDAHRLLQVANVRGPYVAAGHSVGGVYALGFAQRYPADVAGVVLVDSATPHQFDLPTYPTFYSTWRRVSGPLPSLARFGLPRLLPIGAPTGLPADAEREAVAFAQSPRELRADHAEFAELPKVLEQAKALTSLGRTPLAVLTATVGQQSGWLEAQKKLAQLSINSEQRIVTGASHTQLVEDKRFAPITGRAIEEVVQFARTR